MFKPDSPENNRPDRDELTQFIAQLSSQKYSFSSKGSHENISPEGLIQ